MRFISATIHRPIGASLIAIGLLLIGIVSYERLGVASLPNVNFPVIFVHATESGADASTIASTVTAPLERHLGQVAGIDQLRSISADGSSIVFMVFQTNQDINAAAQAVQTAINSANNDLPAELTTPMYRKANPNDDPIIALALTSKTQSAATLYELADTLLGQRLRQLQGISSVEIEGAATPAIRIDVDMHAFNALGLTVDDLRNSIRAANVTSPTGTFSHSGKTNVILVNDRLMHASDFAKLIIATRSSGRIIRLGDIAHVYEGQADLYQSAWFNQKPAVVMYAYARSGANIVETVDRIKNTLPELRQFLSPDTRLTPYFDMTPTIRSSLHEVQMTLCISFVVVIFTMLLFLRRLAPTILATAVIPLSLAGATIVMYILGFTLNNLSLLALVIVIGFVVDDAIVVIENIMRHINHGMDSKKAARLGTREISFTIISITASLIAVFIPILFSKGIIGAFFKEFTLTLIAAIVVSMFVSLFLTPSMCAVFLKPESQQKPPGRLSRWLEQQHERFLRLYIVVLDFSLRHARLLSVFPLLLIFLTFFLAGKVQKGAFPPQDTGLIWGRANSSATVSFEQMRERQAILSDMLRKDPAVNIVSVSLGSGRQGTTATFNIELKTHAQGRLETTQEVVSRLSAKAERFPQLNLRLRAVQDLPSEGGGGQSQGAQYRVSLQGNDLTQLEQWLPKLKDALKKSGKLIDVDTDIDNSSLRQNVVVDRAKAARLGISMGAIDTALYGAFGQQTVSTIYSDTDQYHVVVNALPSQSTNLQSINEISIPSASGQMISLNSIAHQEAGLSPPQIQHKNQLSMMSISYNLPPNVSMGEAETIIHATIRGLRMPEGIQLAEEDDFFARANPDSLFELIIIAIITVYIVLGILYESFIHPVTILSTLPAAGAGALLALFLTHTELSIISMIALILLIGIVKKNAIMMIDFALDAERVHQMTALEAARTASIVRFRPIMMTTMVSILAAIPLAIGLGEGSELRRPLGIALIGGLVISQFLTLSSTPALYVVFSAIAKRCKNWPHLRWRRS